MSDSLSSPRLTRREWRLLVCALYRAADWSEPAEEGLHADDKAGIAREKRTIAAFRKLNDKIRRALHAGK